ncbi:MAG TPA: ShlB/FhaC/HecB family hemolysin secretion/activation protein [Ramlibacter sp.]|uniref:ShlB/FhaC/HecB family hemolysin secretion/activation protein n=1 Tax=Ramlibacter sp. TaxID=1917967 RepID=UPI002ED3E45E
MAALGFIVSPVFAQSTRPDAGTVLETPRQIPALPRAGGAPAVVVPDPAAAATFDRSVSLTPAAFRVQGNTVFSEAQLQAVLAPFVGNRVDMGGLLQAAAAVRQYYRDRGYVLTEAYLPQQQFAASGGTVTIQVLEARVGKASVRVEGAGPSLALADGIVQNSLPAGALINEYLLEKPILLLRDLAGFAAVADVQPGAHPGEADVVVVVKPTGPRFGALLGVDNYGPRAAGEIRGYVEAEALNLAGHGDVLSARAQLADRSDSNLFRLGYTSVVGPWATRLGAQVARTEYRLGKQFAPLGATGEAEVYALNATQPFIRSRAYNLFGSIALERKDLTDRTATPVSRTDRQVDSVRLSTLGNFVDGVGGNSFSSYALSFTQGRLKMDAEDLALDQGASGLKTAGSFRKLNLEFQRTTYFSASDRVLFNVQGQVASRNLTSAEQMSLGGPAGVRGYPVGEGVGDTGGLVQLEYRHQFAPLGSVPLSAGVFYDWGHVKFHEDGAPFPGASSQTLASAGFGVTAGSWGNWLANLQLAWRTTGDKPVSDPDRRPRIWLSVQKWL